MNALRLRYFISSFSACNFSAGTRLSLTSPKLSLSKSFYREFFLSSQFAKEQTVQCPAFAESITEGGLTWLKKVGDYVKEDEQIASISTEKIEVAVNAPCNGVITKLLVENEATVKPKDELLIIDDSKTGSQTASSDSTSQKDPVIKKDTILPQKPISNDSATPSRVIQPPENISKLKIQPDKSKLHFGSRTETTEKMTRMRKRIAERLKDAQNTAAMLTTFNEIDMSSIMELREKYKDAFFKKHNVKLGFMSAFCKGAASTLTLMPEINAVIDGDFIKYRHYVDISIAVATPKGLVVPILRNVETMNFADIEKGIFELGEKARTNALAIEDMDGGTFTISNGGVFGSLFGTPIINPPQSAILGLHGIFQRPIALPDGKIEARPMMYVALTYDHRLIDGREAVTFLRKIKAFIEDPRILFLDI